MSSYQVRWATVADLPIYLGMLRSLVEMHEDMASFLKCSLAQVREALECGDFHLIVLVDDTPGVIYGCISFNIIVSVERGKGLYIEDFFIQSNLRRKGLGRALIEMVCHLAIEMNVSYLKLIYQEGLSASAVYESLGFINMTKKLGIQFFELEGNHDQQLLLQLSTKARSPQAVSFVEVSSSIELLRSWVTSINKSKIPSNTILHDLKTQSQCIGIESQEFPKRRAIVVVQKCFTSWSSKNVIYIDEIIGDFSLINKGTLTTIFTNLLSIKCTDIWVELSKDLAKRHGADLSQLFIFNVSETEGWNVCYMPLENMKCLINLINGKPRFYLNHSTS